MAVTIRPARRADLEVIVEFNDRLARESESKELDQACLRQGVEAFLADPGKGRYFVAEEAGQILGQCSITYEWSDWHNGWYWWFQSVYVRADARGKGVFRRLFEHVQEEAKRSGQVPSLRLYVDESNHSAQAIYQHLGMRRSGYFVLEKKF